MKLIELYDAITDDTPVLLTSGGEELQYYADPYVWDDFYMDCDVTQVSLGNNAVVGTLLVVNINC